MKKTLTLTAAALLLLIGTACGKKDAAENTPASSAGQTPSSSDAPVTYAAELEEKQTVTMEPVVLFDDGGVTVTAEELVSSDMWGDGVRLVMENGTDRNLAMDSSAVIVNGYVFNDYLTASADAGTTDDGIHYFSENDLLRAGIANIGEIVTYITVRDRDTGEELCTDSYIQLRTSAYDGMKIEKPVGGKEIFSKQGIRIVCMGVENENVIGPGIELFIEDDSDITVVYNIDGVTVNGKACATLFAGALYPHSMTLDSLMLFPSGSEKCPPLKKNDKVTLHFHAHDSSIKKDIFSNEEITFTIE